MFKTIRQIWHEAKKTVADGNNLLKATRRVEGMTLDYALLQTIIQSVNNVDISIRLADGTTMKISPAKDEVKGQTFRDRFNEARQ